MSIHLTTVNTNFPILVFLFASLLLLGACVQPGATMVAPPAQQQTQPEITHPTETPSLTDTPAVPTETPQLTQTPAPAPAEATLSPVAEDADAANSDAAPVDAALLALGKEVYARQACGVCHVLTSVGSAGIFGPPHDDMAEIAAQRIGEERYQGSATTPAAYIHESIVDPQRFLADGYQITRFPMPIFTNLTEQEVDALVYLLMQPPTSVIP